MYSLYWMAQPIGLLFGPFIAGAIASSAGGDEGWRWTYLVLTVVPLILGLISLVVLREPKRGRYEQELVLGEVMTPDAAKPELPVSMSTAYQRMKKIKTFYFICTGIGVLGFALVAVPVQLGLLLDNSYGYDAYQRGWMLSLTSIASLIAIPITGLTYDRLFRQNPERVVRVAGGFVIAYGLLLFIAMRFQPIVPLMVFVALAGACTSAAFVSIGPIIGAVAPYRMRTQAFALIPVFIFLMGGFFGGILAGALSDAHGERTALSIVAPIAGTIGGLLFMYGSRYLKRDISLAVEGPSSIGKTKSLAPPAAAFTAPPTTPAARNSGQLVHAFAAGEGCVASGGATARPDEGEDRVDRRRRHADQPAQLGDGADQRLDLDGPAALEVLQHRRLVLAAAASAHSIRLSTSTGKRAPSARPPPAASSIIARTTARRSARAPISSSVASVSALTGLKETLPHSLSPELVADARPHRRAESRPRERPASSVTRGRTSTRRARPASNARRRGGGRRPARPPRTTDRRHSRSRARGRQGVPDPPPGSTLSTRASFHGPPSAWKNHHGNSVLRRDDGGLGAEQRQHRVDGGRHRVRLERDEDVVLRAELGGIVGGARGAPSCLARPRPAPARARGSRRDARRARPDRHVGAGAASRAPIRLPMAPAPKTQIRPRVALRTRSGQPASPPRPMRCSLPVAPLGISSRNTDPPRHLERRQTRARRSRAARARSPPAPSRSTTAAATSSPSLSSGIAKVTACATAGCSSSASSTSRGEIFSPPRLMISLSRPVRRR